MRIAARLLMVSLLLLTIAGASEAAQKQSTSSSETTRNIDVTKAPMLPTGPDLNTSLKAYQDKGRLHQIPGDGIQTYTASQWNPAGYVWIDAWVNNTGTSKAGPFDYQYTICKGEGSKGWDQVVSYGKVLQATKRCEGGLEKGASVQVFNGQPVSIDWPTTKIYIRIIADSKAQPNGEVAESNELANSNIGGYYYIIKKP